MSFASDFCLRHSGMTELILVFVQEDGYGMMFLKLYETSFFRHCQPFIPMLGGPISGKISMANSCQNSCHCSFSMQVPHTTQSPLKSARAGDAGLKQRATKPLCSSMFYILQCEDAQFISACVNCLMSEILQQFQEEDLSSSYLTGDSFGLFVALTRNVILWSGFLAYAAPAFFHVPIYFFFLLASISQVGQRWKSSDYIVYLPTHVLCKASPRLQAQN